MLFGLVGEMGSGKDEVVLRLRSRGHKVTRLGFAVPLKDMVQRAWKIPPKDMTTKPKYVRDLLQIVGTDLFRNQVSETYWIDKFIDVYFTELNEASTSRDHHVIVTDVRFPNEIKIIEDMSGYIVKVERPSGNARKKRATKTQTNHSSETQWKGHTPDFVIINDGTKRKLGDRAVEILKETIHG